MAFPTPFPGLYCDPYFTTSILPVIPGKPFGTSAGTGIPLAASYNGIALTGGNPDGKQQMIDRINLNVSLNCYNGETSVFNCLTMCIGSRYVIMGSGYQADQLIVTALNVSEYISSDIRYPPTYAFNVGP
jgi:hypothetical protein